MGISESRSPAPATIPWFDVMRYVRVDSNQDMHDARGRKHLILRANKLLHCHDLPAQIRSACGRRAAYLVARAALSVVVVVGARITARCVLVAS